MASDEIVTKARRAFMKLSGVARRLRTSAICIRTRTIRPRRVRHAGPFLNPQARASTSMKTCSAAAFVFLTVFSVTAPAQLAPGVRGIATRAPAGMKIDGDMSEWANAFCTPVDYFNPDKKNRSAQFFYMWDDEAFYAALRTLDTKSANFAPDNRLWEGDGVEWYF